MFNEGSSSILQIMNNSVIIIGRQCKSYVDKIDELRVTRGNRHSLLATKEDRQEQLIE